MDSNYYQLIRTEIAALLPGRISRLLEVGCGTGNTSAWIKAKTRCWAAGIELFPEAGREAEGKLDSVIIGDVQTMDLPFDGRSFDLVLCLDVLEHLQNPWAVVQKLSGMLSADGALVLSVPNVRHLSVTFPLLFSGKFSYTSWGLLDKTHLRFFVRDTAIGLIESGGLHADKLVKRIFHRDRFIYPLAGPLREIFVYQYLIRAIKSPADRIQEMVSIMFPTLQREGLIPQLQETVIG